MAKAVRKLGTYNGCLFHAENIVAKRYDFTIADLMVGRRTTQGHFMTTLSDTVLDLDR